MSGIAEISRAGVRLVESPALRAEAGELLAKGSASVAEITRALLKQTPEMMERSHQLGVAAADRVLELSRDVIRGSGMTSPPTWIPYRNARLLDELELRLNARRELLGAGQVDLLAHMNVKPGDILGEKDASGMTRGAAWLGDHTRFVRSRAPEWATKPVSLFGEDHVTTVQRAPELKLREDPPGIFRSNDGTLTVQLSHDARLFEAHAVGQAPFTQDSPGPWLVSLPNRSIAARVASGHLLTEEPPFLPGHRNGFNIRYADGTTESRSPWSFVHGDFGLGEKSRGMMFYADERQPGQFIIHPIREPQHWLAVRGNSTFDAQTPGPWSVTLQGTEAFPGFSGRPFTLSKDEAGRRFISLDDSKPMVHLVNEKGNSVTHIRGPLGTQELVKLNMKSEERLEFATLRVKKFLSSSGPDAPIIDTLEPWKRAAP